MSHTMPVKIIRSQKRAKTVSARKVGDTIEILAPAHLSDTDLQPIITKVTARLERQTHKQPLNDEDLARIARHLNQQYFKNTLAWNRITWSTDQQKRFGSCTPARKTIRISYRLATMPRFVLEYVIMHELAHLVEANHGPRFWKLVNRYPGTERARGYLMAVGLEDLDDESANTTQAPDVD
jgi:predicted metal-dependent hydrolase